MNGLNYKPYVNKVLDTLSDSDLGDLLNLLGKNTSSIETRSLLNDSIYITDDDEGVNLFNVELGKNLLKTGYLIYNDSYCVLLSYEPSSDQVSMFEINVDTKTYKPINETLTTDYLRHEITIRGIEVGEGITVQANDIESGSETAGKVLMADGEGGAEWGDNVVANPTLAGTESALTGLQVGNTKYAVGAGGIELYQHELTFSDNLSGSIYVISTQQTPIAKTASASDLRNFMMNSIITKYGTAHIGYLLSAQDDGGDFPITFKFIDTNSSDQIYVSTQNILESYMNDLIDIVTEL